MPTRYRQLEGSAQIDAGRLETGESAAAANLGRALSGFADMGFEYAAQQQSKKGAPEGLEAGLSGGAPKKGLSSLTAYGKAYNNSALRGYAIKAEADAEDTAARLEVEAANDPEKFKATFGAAMRGALKEAPQDARGLLAEVYTKRLSAGTQRLIQGQAVELRSAARTDAAEGIARSTDRIGNLRASDKPEDALEADEEEVKLSLLIDGAELDGTLTRTEALSARQDSARAVVKQTVSARFGRELDSPYGNPVKFIERLKEANKTSEALPPAEEEKLIAGLISDMQQRNGLDAIAAREQQAEIKARFDAGDKTATSLLLSGKLNRSTIQDMVDSQQLEPSIARTLLNELQQSQDRVADRDDPKAAFTARVNLLDLEEADIATLQGLTYKTRSELILKRREEAQGWKGTQAAKEAKDRIDRALGLPENGFLSGLLSGAELNKREQALGEFYDQIDALPPAERQAAVLRISGEIVSKVIRSDASVRLQKKQKSRADLISKTGDVSKLNKDGKTEFDKKIAKFDADILELQKQAGRQ